MREWVDATSTGFLFHVKAFGIFCGNTVVAKSIPQHIRKAKSFAAEQRLSLSGMEPDASSMLWADFNDCLDPIVTSGKMGCVVFQYHLDFAISQSSKECVEASARCLRPDVLMAVEFRNRGWLGWKESTPGMRDDCVLQSTLEWLKSMRGGMGVILIASDELVSETYPQATLKCRDDCTPSSPDSSIVDVDASSVASGYGVGMDGPVLPTLLTSYPCSSAAYIRIHRREGHARVLSSRQITAWADRITCLMSEKLRYSDHLGSSQAGLDGIDHTEPLSSDGALQVQALEMDNIGALQLQGPCYVLWGTDYEDQPLINMALLEEALPSELRSVQSVKLIARLRRSARTTNAIQNMFCRASRENPKKHVDHPIETNEDYGEQSGGTVNASSDPAHSKKRKSVSACSAAVSPGIVSVSSSAPGPLPISNNSDSAHTHKKARGTITSFFKKTNLE